VGKVTFKSTYYRLQERLAVGKFTFSSYVSYNIYQKYISKSQQANENFSSA